MPPRRKKAESKDVAAPVPMTPRGSSSGSRPFSNPDAFLRNLPIESKAARLSVSAGPDALSEDVKLTMAHLARPEVWSNYAPLLQQSVRTLRDLKLKQYAEFTLEAKRDVTLSQSRIEVWRRVFEERYGLSGDPDSSASTFIEKAVEKLVPDDMENITRYIRFRQIFLMLYKDAKDRRSPTVNDAKVKELVEAAAPERKSRSGGYSVKVGGVQKRRGRQKAGDDDAAVREWRERAEKAETAIRAEALSQPEGCPNVTSQNVNDAKALVGIIKCMQGRVGVWTADYNDLFKENQKLEEQLQSIRNRREALNGAQDWMTADWEHLEELPPPAVAVQELHAQINKMVRDLVGRDEILNRMASIIHTFAYNPYAFVGTYLNYAMLGMPGTGKTTIAREIGKLLRSLGILVTKKFSTVGREDMVGQYLGETAIKTKTLLTNHIEGVLFLDEAYSLGTRDSSGKPDVYGVESLNTLTNFTDKWRGQFSFIAAGYEKEMNEDFFAVNPGLERRFLRLRLPAFSSVQLVKMFMTKLNEKIQSPDEQKMMGSPELWNFIQSAFRTLNECCKGERVPKCYFPNQGGDIENLSDETVQYFYNNVFVRKPPNFTVCDMQKVLQRFLLRLKRESVIVSNPEYDRKCPENRMSCTGDVCVRLKTSPSSVGCSGPLPGTMAPPPPMLRIPTLPGSPRQLMSAPASPRGMRTRPSRRGGHTPIIFWRHRPILLIPRK